MEDKEILLFFSFIIIKNLFKIDEVKVTTTKHPIRASSQTL